MSTLLSLFLAFALIWSERQSVQAALFQVGTACQLPSLQKVGTLLGSSSEVIAADFNRDGKADVLLPSSQQTQLGDGLGGFTPISGNGYNWQRGDEILVGDVNGDGYSDLYVRRNDGGNNRQVQVFVNDKQGRFTPGPQITARVFSFVIGDLNNDGLDDVVANTSGNNAVYLANANGTLARLPNEFGSGQGASLLDLNGDGKLDFVNLVGSTMFLWQGNGNGTFSQVDFLSLTNVFTLFPQQKVADFNRDGRPDLVLLAQCDASLTLRLFLLLNNGRGNFTVSSYAIPKPSSCEVRINGIGDFTGDGFPDIALSDGRIALNDGQGKLCAFSEACCTPFSLNLANINAVADFNGDKLADVINVESFTNMALWSAKSATQNSPPRVTPAAFTTIPQGSSAVEIVLATISDTETPASNLTIEVTALPNLTLNNIRNDNGVVKATPVIGCITPAVVYQLNIRATDAGGLSASGIFNLTAGQNTPPEVGAYPSTTSLTRNGNVTIAPGSPVRDNGTASVSLSAPTFTGNVSINAQGEVAISQAAPLGNHLITVTLTDNCGVQTKREFTVIVNEPSTGGCDVPAFSNTLHLDANAHPYGLASGDFNGDGKPDLATTNYFDHTVTVLLATANGWLKQPAIAVGVLPNYVAARDLNADGKLDLAVVNRGSDTVTILLGQGDGTFTRKGDYEVGNKSTGVGIGDFNGDGKLDLILPNDGLGNAAILEGNGDGSFGVLRYLFAGNAPQPPVVADFNQDGRADVAFPQYFSGEVAILLGLGNSSFQSPIFIGNLGGSGVEAIVVGDLNGDGKPDLAVTNTTTNQLFPLLGNGQGSFANGGGFATGSNYPSSIVIADFTGDGNADIAVGGYNDERISIFKNTGNGFDYNSPLRHEVGSHPLSLVTTDFNGDGKPDLAIANLVSGTVSVLLNGCSR